MSVVTTVEPIRTTGTPASTRAPRPVPPRTPTSRILGVELRKMFDTRSGFWLLASIGITAVLATGAVIVFAPDDQITYDNFGAAVGVPIAILLPMIAILSVTSEWSQRSGLTTFTLVPHRSRVVQAKLVAAIGVGVASMLVAVGVGALGNLLGAAITGNDAVWDISATHMAYIVLANVLGMLVGFMLGVLIRSSAGAIVGYFVYSFVLPTLSMLLAANAAWFEDLQLWVDFNFAQGALFEGDMTGEAWAQLGTAGLIWLVVPLAVGLRLVLRSEVK
ncbi:ABC transporter permease subunit [Nocardioides sp.]|uniref:ABC transporter permease subunit n=1 Tax=Nocardioides sp. TaxID=35761 RepID=UPI00286C596F|nr:ABC transporter permease subunit [Nocardioides sp.]